MVGCSSELSAPGMPSNPISRPRSGVGRRKAIKVCENTPHEARNAVGRLGRGEFVTKAIAVLRIRLKDGQMCTVSV